MCISSRVVSAVTVIRHANRHQYAFRTLYKITCLLSLLCTAQPALFAGEKASLAIVNGSIYTMDPAEPIVEAVAVRNGRIIFAGSADGLRTHVGEDTETIDLSGRTMTPGFIDSHGHLMATGYTMQQLNLGGVELPVTSTAQTS